MKTPDVFKITTAFSIPLLFGSPLIFMSLESLQDFQRSLVLTSYMPPASILPLIWVYSFAGIGLAAFLIWELPVSKKRDYTLKIFLLQFLLNVAWNILFFYYRNLSAAALIIVVMWLLLFATLYGFKKLKPIAAYLSVPYFLYGSYCLLLNMWALQYAHV